MKKGSSLRTIIIALTMMVVKVYKISCFHILSMFDLIYLFFSLDLWDLQCCELHDHLLGFHNLVH